MRACLVIIFLLMLMTAPLVFAAEVTLTLPSVIIEGESAVVKGAVTSDVPFNGTLNFLYGNVNGTISTISFVTSQFSGNYFNYTIDVTGYLADTYFVYALLKNQSGIVLGSSNASGAVNSSMPKIFTATPSGIISKDTTPLSVSTNEDATCRYHTSDTGYENMTSTFINTGQKNHNITLVGLSQTTYTYYVRCKDTTGYVMNTSTKIIFTVDFPPTVQILLQPTSPLKAGIAEISLIVSEPLENSPLIEYSFDDAPSAKKTISLSGSASAWKGFIIVNENDDNKIGSFYFRATDTSGNIGTVITSGNIFVIDTQKPPAPQSIKAVSENDGRVTLSWYYDGEEVDHYNIYRATSAGANYVDFYVQTNKSMRYHDGATADKVTYYYKVSAVDKAGNEGPLSPEIFVTALNRILASDSSSAITPQTASDVKRVLPPDLVPAVNDIVKKIDTLIIDVDDSINTLQVKGGFEKAIIKDFLLLEKSNAAKEQLEALKKQAIKLKESYATKEELDEKLSGIDKELKNILKLTPRDILVNERSDFVQSISTEDIESAANSLFTAISFTEDEKQRFIKKNEKEKDTIKVAVEVSGFTITYLDRSTTEKTTITKKLSAPNAEDLQDVIIIETIPKTIARQVSDVDFGSQKYEVLADDPVVKFGFLNFRAAGERITYSLNSKINPEFVKESKTVALLNPTDAMVQTAKTSGFSIFPLGAKALSFQMTILYFGIAVILALLGYYFIFVKDYKYLLIKLKRFFTTRKLSKRLSENSQSIDDFEFPQTVNVPHSPNVAQIPVAGHEMLSELSSHMATAKAELADTLLPLFVTLSQKLENQGYVSKQSVQLPAELTPHIYINALIGQANHHIKAEAYAEAAALYPTISALYSTLPKDKQAEVYPHCRMILEKLNRVM